LSRSPLCMKQESLPRLALCDALLSLEGASEGR
jgi:hypothetical protein